MKTIKHSHRGGKKPAFKGHGNFSRDKGKVAAHHTFGAGSKTKK